MSTIIVCRTCGENIYNLNAKNLFNRDSNDILKKIQILTGICLIDEQSMPNHICSRCNSDLNHSIAFRERCIETQQLLLNAKRKKSSLLELINDEDESPNSSQMEHKYENVLPYYIIREPNINPMIIDGAASHQLTKYSKINNIVQKSTILLRSDESVIDEKFSKNCNTRRNVNSRKCKKNIALVRNELVENEVVKSRRLPPTEKTFVCDKCGRCFTDSSNLKVHLLRHTGVKDFECKECEAKYFTQHLLNLHIRVRHQGEMPYACKYCDERFFTSTARCRHERVKHIRKMSFACKLCGKKYFTKSCLNKHKFLHTGERPYRCDVCDVGFPRNTNLKIHYRSKQHQRKAAVALVNKLEVVEEFNDVEEEIAFADIIIDEICI